MTAKDFWDTQIPTDANKCYVHDFYAKKFSHEDLFRFAEVYASLKIAEVTKGIKFPTRDEINKSSMIFVKQKRPLWKEAIHRAGANWAINWIKENNNIK